MVLPVKTPRTRKERPPLTEGRVHELALNYLDRYETTQVRMHRHLTQKLRKRALEESLDLEKLGRWIEAVVKRLVRAGLIDDSRYAEARTRQLRGRGKSTRWIQQDLRSRGIEPELIKETLEFEGEDDDDDTDHEWAAAVTLARKRRLGPFSRYDEAERLERRQRSLGIMARAGFRYDMAARVLDAADPDELLGM